MPDALGARACRRNGHTEANEAIDIMQLESAGLVDDLLDLKDIEKEDVDFLLVYVVEFSIALLLYYPFGSLVLFSGILGCGKLPILGGRARDIYLEMQQPNRIKRLGSF